MGTSDRSPALDAEEHSPTTAPGTNTLESVETRTAPGIPDDEPHVSQSPWSRPGAPSTHARPSQVRLSGPDGCALIRRIRQQLFVALAAANLLGVAIVIVCIAWVLPGSPDTRVTTGLLVTNAIMGGVFLLVILPAAIAWGEAWLRSGRRWIQNGREPTDREVVAVLRAPFRLLVVHATAWLIAAFGFSLANALVQVDLLPRIAFTISFGGMTVSAFAYLLAERITRPLAAAALSLHNVKSPKLPGVVARTILAWTLGTAVPLTGLAITAIFALVDDTTRANDLAITMLVLSGIGLTAGWWVTVLGARAVADPVSSLRAGIAQLAEGDFETQVEVYDGSVLGLLQAGFNDMTTGLHEREKLRDLYGRQVGQEVADGVLDRGFSLGGEMAEVAILFVDVVGSTEMAATLPATEVVALLNRFFGVVVDEVHAHGGWVNKFQGDATLAVFGAPEPMEDPAGQALATARAIAQRLPREVDELGAGIGVAYGDAVAGHIGDERRFEFTVIGDPVNEAARLTEVAKDFDPMVLASAEAVAAADETEARCWVLDGSQELRGRHQPTRLARPVG